MTLSASFHHYLHSETGAVTTDFVVLTGGVVGLGMATMAVVSGGVQSLSGDIAGHLSGISVPGVIFSSIIHEDFEDGFGNWNVQISAHEDPLLNGVLGPFFDQSGEPVLLRDLYFVDGTEYAVLEFDLTAVGRWEANDDMRFFVNGELIDATRLQGASIQSVLSDDSDETQVAYQFVERTTTTGQVVDERIDIANATLENGATTTRDAIRSNVNQQSEYTVQVVIRNPGTDMQFGVGRNGRSPYPGEAWAIDEFHVEASEVDPNAPTS